MLPKGTKPVDQDDCRSVRSALFRHAVCAVFPAPCHQVVRQHAPPPPVSRGRTERMPHTFTTIGMSEVEILLDGPVQRRLCPPEPFLANEGPARARQYPPQPGERPTKQRRFIVGRCISVFDQVPQRLVVHLAPGEHARGIERPVEHRRIAPVDRLIVAVVRHKCGGEHALSRRQIRFVPLEIPLEAVPRVCLARRRKQGHRRGLVRTHGRIAPQLLDRPPY
mmetsp:Transcript_12202/g.34649  ORF Transcript_12202/g.34649 Transcript_12202/m.34649 type:complete len:222 (-) Transcript_12202:82-747(-)